MNPGLESRIKEFLPLVPHVEHQRFAEQDVLETKAGRYATEIEEVFVFAVGFKGDFLCGGRVESVL